MEQKGNFSRPKGIVYRHKPGRASPFLLFWKDDTGQRSQSFATAEEREAAAIALAEKRSEHGKEILNFDPREWRAWLAFKQLVGEADPVRVAHEWLASKPSGAPSLTVAEAVEKYLASRESEGLAAGYKFQMKTKLDRLAVRFGSRSMDDVTPDEIDAWIKSLPFMPWTIKDHLKVARTFWGRAKLKGWCRADPTEAVIPPKIEAEPINILTLEQAAKLFSANRNYPVIGRLALEAFGGLRYSSAGRLQESDIKWDQDGVELPGKRHKSGRRHYIDGLPSNLWAWLKIAPKTCWAMTERQYLAAKSAAFIRAEVASSQNCLRHSFATYHVAAHKDAAKTAVLMQHTSPAMLYRHYKGNASQKDGEAYFQILP